MLSALGSPHTAWPAIHVAGTKGKGSTVAMISSILRESGYKVGTYTSPHVVSLHERVAVDGSPISDAALDALIAKHGPIVEGVQASEGGALSHFEILTALAFKHFADSSVDVAVIETGLGGGRDATNVLPQEHLAAAVITAIGHDHADALGGSILSIAAAKAGIMKSGRSVVVSRQPESVAAEVLSKHAQEMECPVRDAESAVQCVAGPIAFDNSKLVQYSTLRLSDWAASSLSPNSTIKEIEVRLGLVGPHQLDNAAAAVTTAAQLAASGQFPKITLESVSKGLQAASLPGRFQLCQLEGEGTGGMLAVLDGAHTPESAAALASTLRAAFPTAPVALVLAMASDKDHRGVCAELRALQPRVAVFTEVPVAGGKVRSAAPGALVAAWQAAGMTASRKNLGGGKPVRTREQIQASLKAAVARAIAELNAQTGGEGSSDGIVVITGSLHAVGTALKDLNL